MISNTIKIVLISIVGMVALTYLVAPKPEQKLEKKDIKLDIKYMPNEYKIVGDSKIYTKQELFTKGEENFIIVGNHESLAVLNDIKKFIDTNKKIILVANISSIPWALKEFAIEPTLEKFMEGRDIKMIFDTRGDVIYSLALKDTNPLNYIVYKIERNGAIKNLYTGKVKSGALDGLMSDEEKRKALEPILTFL